jgi:hypothetical protein
VERTSQRFASPEPRLGSSLHAEHEKATYDDPSLREPAQVAGAEAFGLLGRLFDRYGAKLVLQLVN